MNNIKNAIIALLTGLLALSLFTQPAQSATKTYDAVKLAQYTACLYYTNPDGSMFQSDINGNRTKSYFGQLDYCFQWKP